VIGSDAPLAIASVETSRSRKRLHPSLVQRRVSAVAPVDEFPRRAILYDSAVFEHQHSVGDLDGR
jgi:hypothetical protein